jgi:hypothetical protein
MLVMPAAKRKVSIPTLEDRVNALLEELEDALDELAQQQRPKSEHAPPVGIIRRMLNARGFGDCPCRSYLQAIKENQ